MVRIFDDERARRIDAHHLSFDTRDSRLHERISDQRSELLAIDRKRAPSRNAALMRERKQMRAEQLEFCFEHAGRARLFGGFERIGTDEFPALIAMMRARGAERTHLDQANSKAIRRQL